ncbi:MAG: amidase family protein [Antricoccus sp.]
MHEQDDAGVSERKEFMVLSDSGIGFMSAIELAGRIRGKELSAVEAVSDTLRRMDLLDPHLHAFCTRADESALREARRVDDAIARGEDVGPLAGVPVGIKDLVATKGIRTVLGSFAYEHFVPDEDDIVVERLRDADAIVLGKTNVSELGYGAVSHNPVFETTCNPWDTAKTPGGSSAGSAAAVASGLGPFAIGSDGGGSIRIPASFCGLYGMKPSMGRVPLYPGCRDERYPGVSSWENLEHLGPLSRTVADAALMLSVIAGPDRRDRHSIPTDDIEWQDAVHAADLRGLRVAFSPDLGYVSVDPEVAQIVRSAVRVFESLGCEVTEANPGWEDPGDAFPALVAQDSDLRGMRQMATRVGRGRMSRYLVDLIDREWTAEEFTDARTVRKAIYNRMWRFMRDYDVLVTPTLAVAPFGVHADGPEPTAGRAASPRGWLSFVSPMNMTGQPAATVPAGWTNDGLPVGLQIVGHHLDDRTVLRASAAFETAQPWAQNQPPLLSKLGLQ